MRSFCQSSVSALAARVLFLTTGPTIEPGHALTHSLLCSCFFFCVFSRFCSCVVLVKACSCISRGGTNRVVTTSRGTDEYEEKELGPLRTPLTLRLDFLGARQWTRSQI
jgi:hypothetical protein